MKSAPKFTFKDKPVARTGINEAQVVLVSETSKLPAEMQKEIKQRKWVPKMGATLLVLDKNGAGVSLLVALGEDDPVEAVRRGVAGALDNLLSLGIDKLSLETDEVELAAAAAEAVWLKSYKYDEHMAEKKDLGLKEVIIVGKGLEKKVKQALEIAKGVNLARDLVNCPPDHMSPKRLTAEARKLAKHKNISLKVIDQKEAEKTGWGAFLGVAKGSDKEPQVIHLTYRPTKKAKKKIVVIGKGITFDSGGLSLKPAEFMEEMKSDMAGAATVLGLFSVLPKIRPEVEVQGVIAACENMPSARAYRPGDVLTAKNGKTIEVLNTDAEGRLTLADALTYAAEQDPDYVLDLATLTGASMVALGETVAASFSNDDEFEEEVLEAAEATGEQLAMLPLPIEYRDQIKSPIADVKNIGNSRYGGAITAALFLQEFVADDLPWVHLDIAGPSFSNKPVIPYWTPGASGFGVRLLAELIKNL